MVQHYTTNVHLAHYALRIPARRRLRSPPSQVVIIAGRESQLVTDQTNTPDVTSAPTLTVHRNCLKTYLFLTHFFLTVFGF